MKVTQVGGVKVYDLADGKNIPDFLTKKARRKLSKNPDFARRIELIQDFAFPTYSRTVRVSRDGRYIIASGGYKPQLKVFDVAEVSVKFEHFCDADVIAADFLSDDYSKFCVLMEDRSIAFHSRMGKHDSFRIPVPGRGFTLDRETCDMYIATSKQPILRFNLAEGRFRQSWDTSQQTDDPMEQGHNAVVWNRYHRFVTAAGQDGFIRLWDPRNRQEVAKLDISSGESCAATALCYDPNNDSGLSFIAGDSRGVCRVFDLRSAYPILTKEHPYGTPIQSIQITQTGLASEKTESICVSADSKQIKGWFWNSKDGQNAFNIEPKAPIVDLSIAPVGKAEGVSSGLIFASGDQDRVATYFVPSLGPAPLWASFLENLTEELEEKDQTVYDDWRFVTKEELEDLNMTGLIGTSQVRPWMHGYFVEARTFEKVKAAMISEADLKRLREQAKESKKNERVKLTRKVRINPEIAERSKNLVQDERFQALFEDPAFKVDEESHEFKQMFPGGRRVAAERKRQEDSEDEDAEELDEESVPEKKDKEATSVRAKESKTVVARKSAVTGSRTTSTVKQGKRTLKVTEGAKSSLIDDDDESGNGDSKQTDRERVLTKIPMRKRLLASKEESADVLAVTRDEMLGEQSITFVPKSDSKRKSR